MPASTTTIAALPAELVGRVLDALEPEDRLAARLVCREWAGLPLRHGRAGSVGTVTKLLARLARKPPKTWAACFDLRTLEIASGSDLVPDLLHAALTAPACANLESLRVGTIYFDTRRLDAVATGAPRLRHLSLGAVHLQERAGNLSQKLWIGGNLVLRYGEGAFAALETLEAWGQFEFCYQRQALVIDMPLPKLRTLRLSNAKAFVLDPRHVSPDLRIERVDNVSMVHLMTCACPWKPKADRNAFVNRCRHEAVLRFGGTFGDMLHEGVARRLLPPSVLSRVTTE